MRIRPGVAAIAFLALGVICAGCGRSLSPTALVNQPPTVDFTRFEVAEVSATDGAATAAWAASDPEGGPVRYLVTEDLRAVGRGVDGWTPTVASHRTIAFERPDTKAPGDAVPEPHVLAVRAVDDRGAISPAAVRAWFGDNIAPAVQIVSPEPHPLLAAQVANPITIHWKGQDIDGEPRRPSSYRYHVLREGNSEFPIDVALSNPDSLRRFYEPEFKGWTEVPGESTSVTLPPLFVGRYLFVITAFDAHGDYDPVFSLEKNMLDFIVQEAEFPLSSLVLVGEDIRVPLSESPRTAEVLAQIPIHLHWEAPANANLSGVEYRLDENPEWVPITTPFTIGPLNPGALHLQVEIRAPWMILSTNVGLRAVTPTFHKDLLIVDDTRRVPDQILSAQRPDTMRAPSGQWPNAAELDTFLFARGGVRWRMTPPGTVSPPGVFAGYRFDTLGTRNGLQNPTLAVSLSFLGEYRHIVWIADAQSSRYSAPPSSPINPATTLRWMSSPQETNTLAQWVRAGGRLWAVGGGFASASSSPWNDPSNDVGGTVYSSITDPPDLVPGMFMFDLTHWRSEFIVAPGRAEVMRATVPSLPPPYDFLRFPETLEPKSPATDPIPPNRSAGAFYTHPVDIEYLRLPNAIEENGQSVLDTLMNVRPTGLETWYPLVTLYRGSENGQVVFSGHNIWGYRRQDCAQMVEAVLGGVWGLQPTDVTLTAARRPRVAQRH